MDDTRSVLIIGQWQTKAVWINGKHITISGFVRDLKADEKEPGENQDIIKECRGVRRFSWGDTSQATYCLALACCFYLNLNWVMDRFFTRELQHAPQGDMRLAYTDEELQGGYEASEEQFAHEFSSFMDKIGAISIDENDDSN